MKFNSKTDRNQNGHGSLVVSFLTFSIVTVLAILPAILPHAEASSNSNTSYPSVSEKAFPNYDIRTDKGKWAERLAFREQAGLTAGDVADTREAFIRGENELRAKIPSLAVEYSETMQSPEVISSKIGVSASFLTSPSKMPRPEAVKVFLRENQQLFGLSGSTIDSLSITADYRNPENDLGFVTLEQSIDQIPVFQAMLNAGFTGKGEIIRIVSNLFSGVSIGAVSNDFGAPGSLLDAAARYAGHELRPGEQHEPVSIDASEKKWRFGSGDWATTAEKVYFPIEPGVAVPAWKFLIWQPRDAYYVIVDAAEGHLLWRKNITEEQTQTATYNVFANPNAMIPVADNPNPFTPGPVSPLPGSQGARIPRTTVTRIGNEPPYTFNDLGWIADGGNETDGNAVEAGLERENPNGVDPNGKAVGSPFRVFDFPFNPSNPSGVPDAGEGPLPAGTTITPCLPAGTAPPPTNFQKATVTQLFYISNWFHDEAYRLGFNEPARNFQHDNFGRGGVGGDRISAEAQECTGTNGGNFASPADGSRGRLQLFIWTLPEPDHDGALDAEVAIHELVHGLSNRLHGNSTGLTTNMARAMGEGWSDIYASAMLSEPADPIQGLYTIASYSFYRPTQPTNTYYGIRRFPIAVRSFTGGPNNRPHNPLTFADIDSTQINLSDGAFAPNSAIGGSADQVHNAGEIWANALWEMRARYVQRLGWAVGNRRALQHFTDGMKISPLAPTFLQARDAIIFAALAGGDANDAADAWAGFAIRGMGFSASIQVTGSGTGNARVTEAFDTPNLVMLEPIRAFDQTGNGNGHPEPGEAVTIVAPVANFTGIAANNVSVEIVGGGSVQLGTLPSGQVASQPIPYTVPPGTPCGSAIDLTFNVTSSLGPISFVRKLNIGVPVTTNTESFDSVSAPNIPTGWTAEAVSGGINFVTNTSAPDSPPNSAFALNPTTVGGGTNLTSPSIPISASAATVAFRNNFLTEAGWDGGVLEISVADQPFQDVIVAGGSFIYGPYNGTLGANGVNNPIAGRPAWTGNSQGYIDSQVRLPASANGQNVRLRWRFGADDNTAPANGGWHIDNVEVVGSYTCTTTSSLTWADYDGDGKTDISVFRPSDGNWYLLRSQAGFAAVNFGIATDIITPGDYDGDGITDIAVWRPANGEWYIMKSSGGFIISQFGTTGDIPVTGDYDGDGLTDLAVYRPSTNVWYIQRSSGGFTIQQFGSVGDVPIRGDFDGDGKADLGIYRNGQWWIARSSGGFSVDTFGIGSDKPVPADYDGDGKTDLAVFRPSDGIWYILRSSDSGISYVPFGISTDIPVAGDYDGDGKTDQAVYRDGIWYLNRSTAGFAAAQFGLSPDRPTPLGYLP